MYIWNFHSHGAILPRLRFFTKNKALIIPQHTTHWTLIEKINRFLHRAVFLSVSEIMRLMMDCFGLCRLYVQNLTYIMFARRHKGNKEVMHAFIDETTAIFSELIYWTISETNCIDGSSGGSRDAPSWPKFFVQFSGKNGQIVGWRLLRGWRRLGNPGSASELYLAFTIRRHFFSEYIKKDSQIIEVNIWDFISSIFCLFQVFELFTQYLSYTATTQMYDKREEAPFPDVSICNLESNLDDVIAVKDYLTKLDDVIAQNQEDIDVVNQVQGLKNKFALFQNLDNASLEEIDRYFVAQCFWITNKRLHINCSESVSRLIYTETFGQCYTFSTLLWRNTGEAHGIYSIKVLLYLNQFQSGNSHLIRNKFHQVDQMNGGGKRLKVLRALNQWWIQDFPEEGAPTYYFSQFLSPKTAWKWKKSTPWGPHWTRQCKRLSKLTQQIEPPPTVPFFSGFCGE